jgi:hypothetical protein
MGSKLKEWGRHQSHHSVCVRAREREEVTDRQTGFFYKKRGGGGQNEDGGEGERGGRGRGRDQGFRRKLYIYTHAYIVLHTILWEWGRDQGFRRQFQRRWALFRPNPPTPRYLSPLLPACMSYVNYVSWFLVIRYSEFT